jgi:UDP-glucuronate 4-epimerase
MAVLIAGGAGFIGSRLAAKLVQQQKPVIVLDNFDSYYDPRIKRANISGLGEQARIVEGDIRDRAGLERLFAEYHITHIANMAGLAGVRNSIEQGPLYSDVNVTGAVHLMDLARRHNVKLFIQASTSSVYGQTSRIPFREEDAPDEPLAAYPASKRAAELFGYSYHHMFGLNFSVLRFFNVYGPNGRPDMMPLRAIEAILQQKPLPVYDNGELKRDWTYVDDVVAAIMAALDRPMGFALMNIGYGAPISLNEFIEIYEDLIGQKAIRQPTPAPASEPRITYCDNTRARERLGFNPQVHIREGLARTWAWYQKHHGLATG